MLYLKSFSVPDDGLAHLDRNWESKRTCYGSRYPFGVFHGLSHVRFEPLTILCGGNGSGKTTLLNLIGEKLELQRGAPFNRSAFFGDYLDLCQAETASAFDREVRGTSRVITSDDVFDYLLDLRCMNEGIDTKRRELLAEYADKRYARFQMRSLADLDELRKVVDAQRHTGSRYVNEQLMRDVPGQSNGESGFLYFTRHIGEGGLYLLDEPENSLSVRFQQELAKFLEDSVRFYRCQFIVATHSPILLALKDARVYDLDRTPASVCRWTEVADVADFYAFFKAHEADFQQEKR
ncbi:AAA family ATPase [uncultured Dysosmobacter sp.]|uniref:AAA family ATPase n=1 Tax=uncultured Dysosmobacter sp. TaxID=2591384 RepID=UPI002631ADED|nr:AAA family ATPase [uncultured Dysosmobacter sp.]